MLETARLKIPYPNLDGSDTPVDIPTVWYNRAVILDSLAPISEGPLSGRPISSSGSSGITGRFYIVTDQPSGDRLDMDIGSGWVTVGPALIDAVASTASLRTLGTGAHQACAGNDPRLVGGANASGDITGEYPGPLTVATWGGQTKGTVVAGSPPQAHGSSHRPGGSDPLTNLTDASIAAANKDGAAGTPSLRSLGVGALQAFPGNKIPAGGLAGQVLQTDGAGNFSWITPPSGAPVGSQVPYAGTGDPAQSIYGTWVVADGRLIDSILYPAFDAVGGHAAGDLYNGGVNPGVNGSGHQQCKIPDKRGKGSIGAINMGTGSGPNDNSHVQLTRGASSGEVNHTLVGTEGSVNGNGSTQNSGTGVHDTGHNHYAHNPPINPGDAGWVSLGVAGGASKVPNNNNFAGGSLGFVDSQSAAIADPTHGHLFNSRSADSSHNTVHPVQADSWIVRIA